MHELVDDFAKRTAGGPRPDGREPLRGHAKNAPENVGSEILNGGCPIEVVSKQMGRANTRITEQAYAKLLSTTQREEVLKLGTGYPFFVKDRLPRRRN
jgi:hypothetical protein